MARTRLESTVSLMRDERPLRSPAPGQVLVFGLSVLISPHCGGQAVGTGPGGRWTVMIRWQASVPVPR